MRRDEIEAIIDFVDQHPESYASLAVCRRALDPGLPLVTKEIKKDLQNYLQNAPEDEVLAYYYIVS